jgi:hypothetical protein
MTQVIDLLGYDRIVAHASALSFTPKRQRFIFVRHGETEGNRTKRYQMPHTPLNETGEDRPRAPRKASRRRASANWSQARWRAPGAPRAWSRPSTASTRKSTGA